MPKFDLDYLVEDLIHLALNNMEKIIWIILFFAFMNVMIGLIKVLWAKIFKYTFTYWEILIDTSIFISICIISWSIIEIYNYLNIDTFLVKLLSGLLFMIAIPYLLLFIRRNIYSKLKYNLAFESNTLYVGYFYVLLIVALLIWKLVYSGLYVHPL